MVARLMASPEASNRVGQGQGESAASAGPGSLTISCNRCRKIKLRCSRDRPSCLHCSKAGHDCVYECSRGKPGVKAGAIENIHRRLDQLEHRLLRQEDSSGSRPQLDYEDTDNHVSSRGRVLTLLATELLKLASPPQGHHGSPQESSPRPTKRRRVEGSNNSADLRDSVDDRPPLPSSETIDIIVRTYFSHIHPWIPMLHLDIFPQKLRTAEGLLKLRVVVHAISLAVEPHLPSGEGSSMFDSTWPAHRVREWVVTQALENVSLEGLQALIIVTFTDIGNGNASRAWSLVASLSRTVEFAQLTMEHDQDPRHQPICRPYTSLEPARNWTEQEERRRVFWNVFLLDRLCSTTMGWTTSLKSIEVHQRLPCDGSLWRRQDSGLTPYLGIWDKSTGGMANKSTGCFPGGGDEQSESPLGSEPWAQHPGGMYSSPSTQQTANSQVDMSRVGAFGYCIEATESMSRVVSCFLQQRVNIDDPVEVNAWLGRFKELDMRLVHWKMFLPQKWKNNVPPSTPSGDRLRIDPNLTLAHVTHNTSTILLHQVIAYPPPHWPFRKRLPSAWSADTCCFAGAEIATITSKYLQVTPGALPVTSSFAFCVYIAARMMIVHWRFEEENKLMDEFWSLVRCLDEMSTRWRGCGSKQTQGSGLDIAAKYAEKLRYLCKICSEDDGFQVFVSDYTCEIDYRATPAVEADNGCSDSTTMVNGGMVSQPATNFAHQREQNPMHGQTDQGPQWTGETTGGILPVPDMTTTYPPQESAQPEASSNFALVDTTRGQEAWGDIGSHGPVGSGSVQGVDDMMSRHWNDSFMDMDRVIAFTDRGLFSAELEDATW